MNLRIISLYSGSGGNSTLIATKSSAILIDAGKSARTLCAALKGVGVDADRIDAVFVTHEHTDHISALEVLEKKHNIPIHITDASAGGARVSPDSRIFSRMVRHTPHFDVQVGNNMHVSSFCTSHDSAMSVGYRVEIEEDGEKHVFGIATDTGYVTEEMKSGLRGCDSVLIESNHDVERLKCGSYPLEVKRRILGRTGHLSNEDCAALAADLAIYGTRNFMLGHLSEENNTVAEALNATTSALSAFDGVRVSVARPDCETVII